MKFESVAASDDYSRWHIFNLFLNMQHPALNLAQNGVHNAPGRPAKDARMHLHAIRFSAYELILDYTYRKKQNPVISRERLNVDTMANLDVTQQIRIAKKCCLMPMDPGKRATGTIWNWLEWRLLGGTQAGKKLCSSLAFSLSYGRHRQIAHLVPNYEFCVSTIKSFSKRIGEHFFNNGERLQANEEQKLLFWREQALHRAEMSKQLY